MTVAAGVARPRPDRTRLTRRPTDPSGFFYPSRPARTAHPDPACVPPFTPARTAIGGPPGVRLQWSQPGPSPRRPGRDNSNGSRAEGSHVVATPIPAEPPFRPAGARPVADRPVPGHPVQGVPPPDRGQGPDVRGQG